MNGTTRTIHNTERYLSPTIINQCFIPGKVTHVDKLLCGNGFTTGFLKIKPKEKHVNVIIVPNRAVIQSKENAYRKNGGSLRIKFFYRGSQDSNFNDADVLMFVADSFLNYASKFDTYGYTNLIDKVLIDEYHSIEQQSSFRYNLIEFIDKVQNTLPGASITTVTATPLHYSKIDIRITADKISGVNVNISRNADEAIKRAKDALKQGGDVVIFTQNKNVISKFKDYKKIVRANFNIGTNLMRNIVSLAEIQHDADSKLHIVSSRGFEGFDLYLDDASIFFFEDRSQEHQTFTISNLYQAINRNRKQSKYIEYCRQDLSSIRKNLFKDIDTDISDFINDSSISNEKKLTKEYAKYHPFIIHEQDDNGVFTLRKNEVEIRLYKERNLYDLPSVKEKFKSFLDSRKITLNELSEINNRAKHSKMKDADKIKYLKRNESLINDLDLFGDEYKLKVFNMNDYKGSFDLRKKYLDHYKDYLMHKNYNGLYTKSKRQEIALRILTNELEFRGLVKEICKAYEIRQREKHSVREAKKKVDDFKETAVNVLCQLILSFSKSFIDAPPQIVANRDYNVFTQTSIKCIQIIAQRFNVKLTELDIKTCNPRILYALSKLNLPNDFYGVGKINKKSINVYLNSFRLKESNTFDKKYQVRNTLNKFRKFGFDERVIEYLMQNFFEARFKGDLFNFLAFHEKQIIKQLRNSLDFDSTSGIVRRHDSLLLFDNQADLTHINGFRYYGVGGWFDTQEKDEYIQGSISTGTHDF